MDLFNYENQIGAVNSFEGLISTPFHGELNALCWKRKLSGDFTEIVNSFKLSENMLALTKEELLQLKLSEQGQRARETLINDMKLLEAHGASPVLNLIKYYERDDFFFPTDVYSFHVDRSPVPTSTFLCTYHGASSDIIPNTQAEQKVLVPEIRDELKKLYDGPGEGFEAFLTEHFFDLHYQVKSEAEVINLEKGNLWKLAVDHPESKSLPCIHRAPAENGDVRLLLIC